jgi:two-component system NtrC family sensor kinase
METPVRQGPFAIDRLTASLTFKLLCVAGLGVLTLSGLFWYRSLLLERRQLLESAAEFAGSYAEIVRRGLRDDMLRFDQETVRRNISSVARAESILGVKVYNSHGKVVYASDRTVVGQQAGAREAPCLGCHHDPLRPHETLFEEKRYTVYAAPDGSRILSYVDPIYNEPDCSSAACHVHPPSVRVLGVMLTDFSLVRLDRRVNRQIRDFSVFVLLYVLSLASLGYFVLWRLVLRPLGLLSRGMDRLAAGDLRQKVPVTSEDELGRLAASFNAMTDELSAARERTARLTHGLEDEVERKTLEVRRTEGKLAEAEKLAALGRLTAEIAHEIRNPLTALGGYGRRLQRTVATPEKHKYADIVVAEVDRLERILKDILDFSHPGRFELRPQGVAGIIEQSLAAFGERCAAVGVRIETALADDHPVLVDPLHLRRALDNLLANALDVMPGGGTLSVSMRRQEMNCARFLVVTIADTGPGIPEEVIPRIFEPFYTSKRMGHGTGLGLSITRKIVEAHGSFIGVENRREGGLAVSLHFPCQSPEDLQRTPCWESMRCGRTGDDGGEPCPAYPHFGRVCWAVAGTLCQGRVQGEFAKKLGDCRRCEYFKQSTNCGS